MRGADIGLELAVVSNFVENYMTTPGLADCAYARELLTRAGETFVQHVDERKECEACVTELLQFSRSLAVITAEHPELSDFSDYLRDFNASVAALKRVAAAVRLHFLLEDLRAIVDDQ